MGSSATGLVIPHLLANPAKESIIDVTGFKLITKKSGFLLADFESMLEVARDTTLGLGPYGNTKV